jgi:hypothetical protein
MKVQEGGRSEIENAGPAFDQRGDRTERDE